MEVVLAADHNGWKLKNELADWLRANQFTVTDLGPEALDQSDDYPDYGFKAAEWVAQDPDNRRGILVCGTGIGMNVAANKVKGVRAAMISDYEVAATAQRDDQVNVLALGAKHITLDGAKAVVQAWLDHPFTEEERHQRRISKITDYEQKVSNL